MLTEASRYFPSPQCFNFCLSLSVKKLKGNFYLISLSSVPIQFVHGKSHTLPVLLLAIFLRKIPPVNQVSRTCNLRSAIKASSGAAGWFTCQLIAAGHLISPACWMDFSSCCLLDSCCSGQRIKSYNTCTFSEVFRLIHEISGSSSIKQKEKKLNISQRSFAEVEQEAYYTWQPKLKTYVSVARMPVALFAKNSPYSLR